MYHLRRSWSKSMLYSALQQKVGVFVLRSIAQSKQRFFLTRTIKIQRSYDTFIKLGDTKQLYLQEITSVKSCLDFQDLFGIGKQGNAVQQINHLLNHHFPQMSHPSLHLFTVTPCHPCPERGREQVYVACTLRYHFYVCVLAHKVSRTGPFLLSGCACNLLYGTSTRLRYL